MVMIASMKWQKGKASVEITSASEYGKSVHIVKIIDETGNEVSSHKNLPIEFGRKIAGDDKPGQAELSDIVEKWATRNGYTQMPPPAGVIPKQRGSGTTPPPAGEM